ncbi:PPOX class F420-dependent oxidoreductase [Solihabitans fulvus]|uniref:PPOX class F420-dependent oxidoreductase n=1 Tax=Solihabitans fulvus TaxID=1892852 RepID=A0A5B2WJ57_9PSEU|nr:PPOX class F420-dependent oxidoreductase [Solihabitans fulvus]KAA2251445.1 PPOX class F420-dependent oxidoreductase [Solihabitans fulvus]
MAYTEAPEGWWREFVSGLPARTGKLAVVRKDGSPHIAPVWVDLDGPDLVFLTGRDTIKGKAILRDGRVALCFDDERPPFHFVTITGRAVVDEDIEQLRYWAGRTAARYMGADRANEFAERNAVPGELLVRVKIDKVVAKISVSD